MARHKDYVRGLSENYPGFRFSNSIRFIPFPSARVYAPRRTRPAGRTARFLPLRNSFPLNLESAGNCVIIRLRESALLFTTITYEYIVSRALIVSPNTSPEKSRFLESYGNRKILNFCILLLTYVVFECINEADLF